MQTKRVVPAARCLLVGVYFLAQRQKHRRPSASGAQKSAISLIVLAMAPSSWFNRRDCGSYKKQSRQGIMPGGYGGPSPAPHIFFFHPVSLCLFFCVRPGRFAACQSPIFASWWAVASWWAGLLVCSRAFDIRFSFANLREALSVLLMRPPY